MSVGRPSPNVTEKDFLDNIAPVASTVLPHASRDAMSIVLNEMRFVCMVYYVDFQHVLEAYKDVTGNTVDGKVDLILNNSQYICGTNAVWKAVHMTSSRLKA